MSALTRNRQTPSITLDVNIIGRITGRQIGARALLDSGAEGIIMHSQFARTHRLTLKPLQNPFPVRNVDGTENIMGWVRHTTTQTVRIYSKSGQSYHEERAEFYITDIGDHDIILGTDWLDEHNPEIDWTVDRVDLTRCPESCTLVRPPVQHLRTKPDRARTPRIATEDPRSRHRDYSVSFKEPGGTYKTHPVDRVAGRRIARAKHSSQSTTQLFTEDEDERPVIPDGWVVQGLQAAGLVVDDVPSDVAKSTPVDECDELPSVHIRAGFTKSQELAEKAADRRPRTLEEMVPEQYRDYQRVFDKQSSERFPERRTWDHAIDLKPGFEPKSCKIYPLSPTEQAELKTFLEEHLAKGYIRPSKSPMASPFFFVKKKDGRLRPVQDYRYLNTGTVKNEYPLPLVSELVDKLKGARVFSKMDVRWGYNNIRIKEGDEWKAAFKTNQGLFEPTVMFFGLMNSPATFQAMMNEIFRDLIDDGKVVVYMDDILVFTNTLDEHQQIVRQVLQRLQDHDLFLKPEKCEFERDSIEYLGLVISHDKLEMDPVKVAGVAEWPTPQKVKDVQAFLGFSNFYRRFIKDYSKIARPLFDLTKKDMPWSWTQECEAAFVRLKATFTSSPVLLLPDPDKRYLVEVDASDFATGGVLSQKGPDDLWHPVAYLSKSLSEPERNYDIYDKELLAIVRALEAWRHYLEGSPHAVEIWTDHKNLEYFKTAQKLNRRQARWSLFLSRFDFVLVHKPGISNRSDAMSRRPDHREGVEDDNSDRVLLDPKFFRIRSTRPGAVNSVGDTELRRRIRDCPTRDLDVARALDTIMKNGPRSLAKGLQEWNYEEGLILFRGKVYVPADRELRRDIVKRYHDSPMAGHPGRHKTYELVSREFWWPGMSVFVRDYVRGCAVCQATKNQTNPHHIPLVPNAIPTRPFGVLTTDYVTDLPPSGPEGYDALNVTVDRSTKAIFLSPCHKTIDADGTVDLLFNTVYRRVGLWDQLISDRGAQFASKVTRGVLEKLGVQSSLSTAYHPQTDGETERVNQEVEQYLRAFCNYRQDDWVRWLPYAEFSHNSRVHSATGRAPFELWYGFIPRMFPAVLASDSTIPAVNERLRALEEIRKEAEASLHTAAELMKRNNGDWTKESQTFKNGDLVWLDGKNLKTMQPKAKLAAKRHGPFPITDVLGPVTYRLDIPKTWKQIHPVFHASLLLPYVETEAHGPNFPRAPAELVEGEEEVEVEKILDSRPTRNRRGIEYLIKWKGYPDSENEWIVRTNLPHAQEAIADFHRRHPSAPRPLNSLGISYSTFLRSTLTDDIAFQEKARLREGVMSRLAVLSERFALLLHSDQRPVASC